jgi:hypothetical protein
VETVVTETSERQVSFQISIGAQVDQSALTNWKSALREHLEKMEPQPSMSSHLERHIRKRVAPSFLSKYLNHEGAIGLAINELGLILERIRQYRVIDAYPKHFSSNDRDVISAFFSHLHSLRSSELYLIQERGKELLRFSHCIASDLRLSASDQSREFDKKFKKGFERRLRERHRLVHAHERPSLMTRMLDVVAGVTDRAALEEAIGSIALSLFSTYATLKSGGKENVELDQEKFSEMKGEMQQIYIQGFDNETAAMRNLVTSHFSSSFSILSNTSSDEVAQRSA